MKKARKLIPALCMLLVSVTLLGATTYAWFSMNNQVTATGMQVTATSNSKYLVITTAETIGDDYSEIAVATDGDETKNTKLTKVGGLTMKDGAVVAAGTEGGTVSNNVYPVHYNYSGSAETVIETEKVGTEGYTNTSIANNTWYTANSTINTAAYGGSSSAKEVKGFKTLTDAFTATDGTDLTNYALKYTMYIGLAKGSNEVASEVTVTASFSDFTTSATSSTVQDADKQAIKALIKFGSEEIVINGLNTEVTSKSGKFSSTTFKELETHKVEVYLYVDGDEANVKSNNDVIKTLSAKLKLTFAIDA